MAVTDVITLVGYIDDTATIMVALKLEIAQIKTEDIIRIRVARWMRGARNSTSSPETIVLISTSKILFRKHVDDFQNCLNP